MMLSQLFTATCKTKKNRRQDFIHFQTRIATVLALRSLRGDNESEVKKGPRYDSFLRKK